MVSIVTVNIVNITVKHCYGVCYHVINFLIGLMNALAEKHSLPRASWLELLNELTSSSSFQPSSPVSPYFTSLISQRCSNVEICKAG